MKELLLAADETAPSNFRCIETLTTPVMVIRSIIEPAPMLYDEPTGALDPETVGEVPNVMQGLADQGMTSIVVTHEPGFAWRAADEVVFMDAGQAAHRAPDGEFFSGSAPERVQRFLSRMHA